MSDSQVFEWNTIVDFADTDAGGVGIMLVIWSGLNELEHHCCETVTYQINTYGNKESY